MDIMVGVAIHRPIEFRVFESFIRMANSRGAHNYSFTFVQNSLVYDARESIVKSFLDSKCEALMMIDSDMTFHPQSIEFLERHNKPYVTAKAFKRVEPYQPCFYTKVERRDEGWYMESPVEYGEGLLKIEGSGMACCLIRREVFDKIKSPYFFPEVNLGEDLTFCQKLKLENIDMYVDTTLQFGHLANIEILEKDFQKYYNDNKNSGKPLYES